MRLNSIHIKWSTNDFFVLCLQNRILTTSCAFAEFSSSSSPSGCETDFCVCFWSLEDLLVFAKISNLLPLLQCYTNEKKEYWVAKSNERSSAIDLIPIHHVTVTDFRSRRSRSRWNTRTGFTDASWPAVSSLCGQLIQSSKQEALLPDQLDLLWPLLLVPILQCSDKAFGFVKQSQCRVATRFRSQRHEFL